jgi:hypothetical protein
VSDCTSSPVPDFPAAAKPRTPQIKIYPSPVSAIASLCPITSDNKGTPDMGADELNDGMSRRNEQR